MHERGKKKEPNPRRSLLIVGIVSFFLLVFCVSWSHLQITWDRIKLLHNLAMSKDEHKIRMTLGELYVEAGEYSKAINCYRMALPKHWCKLNLTDTIWAWEMLDKEDPFDPNVHLGFGEVLESLHQTQQAEMEYKQALTLSPHNKEAEDRLTSVKASSRNEKIVLQPMYQILEADLASKWTPPTHTGCLVTRCLVGTDNKGIDFINVTGRSGSNEHDQSALAILNSIPCKNFLIFRMDGMYDFGCMSEGQKKTITFTSLGEFNAIKIEPTPMELVTSHIQTLVHSFQKHTGALRL